MSLTIEQRLAVLSALPVTLDGETVLVFEDDGGGWHHNPSVESWISFSISPGPRYLYNIRSQISETWNGDELRIDDERGELHQGTINLYICSTNKRTVQSYEYLLSDLIERQRLGLSLDFEGITTGPEVAVPKSLGSYNDLRLKKRVYRTLIEIPVLYKYAIIEYGDPIRVIEVEPWIGLPLAEMEHYYLRAPLLLRADIVMCESVQSTLEASICLDESA